MKYRARMYICASYLGYVDCDSYELKKDPFSLYFYDKNGNCVGHIEPLLNLIARVQIYELKGNGDRKEAYVLSKQYAFRNKGPAVIDTDYEVNCGKHKKLLVGSRSK